MNLDTLKRKTELFHDEKHECFATIHCRSHRETYPIQSRGFRAWLLDESGWAPSGNYARAETDALIERLEAAARRNGVEQSVFLRVALHNGCLWLDLGGRDWRAVEITSEGWSVVTMPPVRFRRSRGMGTLPVPERGGSIEELRRFLNVPDDASFTLIVGWLLGCLHPYGPFPLLLLMGEPGSATSFAAGVLRSLVDPAKPNLRSPPVNEHDLAIAAKNCWVLALDNLSAVTRRMSDAFCRLSTGGGYATRKLYTDDEEHLFSFTRPLVLTSVSPLFTRADLTSRTIAVSLPVLRTPRPEAELLDDFQRVQPRILGALLDAVSVALKTSPLGRRSAPSNTLQLVG